MKDNARKITKIVDELTYFLLRSGTKNLTVGIKREEAFYVVCLEGDFEKTHLQEMNDIEKMLTQNSRDKSMEAVYWELMGVNGSGCDSELQLIGMMIDEAKVIVGEEKVFIEIRKKLSSSR